MKAGERINNKVLVLGIDGMDPRFTVRMLKEGKMPHFQAFLDKGSAREDLVLLGGHPTGTPPMWTSLATGAYAYTHGITCFNLDSEMGLDYTSYGLDSKKCKAEQMWNVTAEAGLKTLVFHWPGSSWPPSSESENLHVIDGTQPSGVNMGTAIIEGEFVIIADKEYTEAKYVMPGGAQSNGMCVISDLEVSADAAHDGIPSPEKPDVRDIAVTQKDGLDGFCTNPAIVKALSPIKYATGWAKELPEGALEFTMMFANGLTRRVGLILKNEAGVYDRVEMYKNKKAEKPIVVLPKDVFVYNVIDETKKGEETFVTNKSMRVVELAEDGSSLRIYVGGAMDTAAAPFFHPQSLHKQVIDAAGYIPHGPMTPPVDNKLLADCMCVQWDYFTDWQAKAMHALIEQNDYDVIFSHCHNVDAQVHQVIRYMVERDYSLITPEEALADMERVYVQTDNYIGKFAHYADEGWTVFVVSDHGLVCPVHERPPISEPNGIAVQMMRELGFTEVLKDANGNDMAAIDWSKTKAVASRCNHIYLNLKEKYEHGIVAPEDQWEVEDEIITALYGYRHPESGRRVIELAVRNKDAVLLGLGGEHSGDIVYWTADNYNDDHFDGLSTCYGVNDTSLSPIFAAAGVGIKKGYKTDRVIREVDVTPTVAQVLGLRMPEQCEGAVIYQILE